MPYSPDADAPARAVDARHQVVRGRDLLALVGLERPWLRSFFSVGKRLAARVEGSNRVGAIDWAMSAACVCWPKGSSSRLVHGALLRASQGEHGRARPPRQPGPAVSRAVGAPR